MATRKHPVVRWIKRIALGFAGLLVLSVGGALAALHTDWGREIVRQQIEVQLGHAFTGGGTIGKLEGSPFGELVARDVKINGPDGKPAIQVGSLHVELSLLPLVSHELRLDRLVANDVDVVLARDAGGGMQIEDLLKPGPPSTWSVALLDVEVHRGHVRVDTGAADPEVRVVDLDGVTVDAAATLPDGGAITATAIAHAVLRQRAAPVDLAVTLRADGELVTAPSALLSVGGVGLAATDLRMAGGGTAVVSGLVAASAPAAALARLVPGVQLPDDVALAAFVGPDGGAVHASIFGRLGATPIRAFVRGELARRSARGVLVTGNLDANKLTRGELAATGGAVVAFDVVAPAHAGQLPAGSAVITAWGALDGEPPVQVAIALSSDGELVQTVVGALTPGARVGLGASVRKRGDAVTLEAARLVAGARDPARITPRSPALYGSLRANLSAHGALWPAPDLAVAGTLDGEHLKLGGLTIASLQLRIDARDLPAAPLGSARLAITGLDAGPEVSLATVTIAAVNRPDHTIVVGVRARPRGRPWLVDADAIVTPGPTTVVQLTHHHVRADGTDWTGTTGRVAIGPRGVSVTDLRTASAKGALGVDVHYTHAASAGRLTVAADAAVPSVGTARLALDVDAPATLGDVAGWGRLTRAAIRKGELVIHADLGKTAAVVNLSGVSGTVDAKLAITPTDLAGTIELHELAAPALARVGAVSAHVEIAQHGTGDVTAQAVAKVDGVGGIRLSATAAAPERPFDVAAWRALGRDAVKGAQVKLDEVTLGPALFDRLHVHSELRGKVDFTIDVAAGARAATLALDAHQLRGGPIARPLEVHLDAHIDEHATTAALHVRTLRGELVSVDATAPLTLAAVLADPRAALAAPLHATATLPNIAAAELLATFGRGDITKGLLAGTIEIAGTIGRPTAIAKLAATDLEVLPGAGATQPQVMRKLALDASWDGAIGKVKITGEEATGGALTFTAQGSPAAPDAVTASLDASRFDLRTLAAFAPGPAGGISGQLDGKLTVKGIEPRTMDVHGKLAFTAARVPIAPQIGTLRQANIQVTIGDHVIKIDASGKLGRDGTVKLVAEAPLDGGPPTGGKATLTVRKVSPIGAIQPVIDSDITATIGFANDTWTADVKVAHTLVKIPDDRGQALDPVGPPTDMVYGPRRAPQHAKTDPTQKAPPPHPVLIAKVDLDDVTIESSDARGVIRGKLTVSLGEAPVGGSPIGIVGDIDAQRGVIALFDRRYQIDHAALHFDGSPDPQLDVRVTYDFPDVTTVTEVHGRLSKPELALSSEPGIYSQGELLGFLLGGEPNGDPQQSQSTASRVSGAGASLLANQVSGYVKKALPISVDVIKYEAASSMNSAAITLGSWVTHTLFVAYREHLDARPDENTGEGDVEYYLRPRLFLDGTVGDRGYDGLDLLWRKRW